MVRMLMHVGTHACVRGMQFAWELSEDDTWETGECSDSGKRRGVDSINFRTPLNLPIIHR